ncbi:hypothetical protein KCU62_g56, partial [Aureobasidium sp. EXF-3399]
MREDLPIRDCLVPQSKFMFAGSSEMLHKLVAKDFSRNAVLALERLDSLSQAFGQSDTLVRCTTDILTLA